MTLRRLARTAALRTLRSLGLPAPQGLMADSDHSMLLAHVRDLVSSKGGRVLLVGDAHEIRSAYAVLKANRVSTSSLLASVAQQATWDGKLLEGVTIDDAARLPDISGAVIVAHTWNDAMSAHKRLAPLKRKAVPVVCAYACRTPSADTAWQWTDTGMTRVGMFQLAARYLQCLRDGKGDYLEFGCFDGQSIGLAYHTIGARLPRVRFVAFDSFQGIQGALPDEKFIFPDGDYFANVESFWQNMRSAGVDTSRVLVVPGDFATSLSEPARLRQQCALQACVCAHIDCDVYQPARMALEFLSDLLVDGALLLFDEYDDMGSSTQRGEKRAVREWLKAHPDFELEEYRRYEFACRAFIFGRKTSGTDGAST